jgi:hypothetical protein
MTCRTTRHKYVSEHSAYKVHLLLSTRENLSFGTVFIVFEVSKLPARLRVCVWFFCGVVWCLELILKVFFTFQKYCACLCVCAHVCIYIIRILAIRACVCQPTFRIHCGVTGLSNSSVAPSSWFVCSGIYISEHSALCEL